MKISPARKKLMKLLRKAARAAPPPDAGIQITIDDGNECKEVTIRLSSSNNPLANLLTKNK